ncbi:hypothetical protein [Mixta sp. Marseille-Q2659]|uniref:hypothetical protein n=1 Tax=Mixta sp. Marseille-Q2659 TaxID=2736607 RepID=UPI0023B920FA|nr:hypothetical protein [Mixta sp. Marseille-Q2659]
MTQTNPTVTTDTDTPADQDQSFAYRFLEAILRKDDVTLRSFGVDDKTTAQIDLKTQIDVAQKLLASDNNSRRAMSKRLLAAKAGLPTKIQPVTTTEQNADEVKATFHRSVPKAKLKAVK